MIKKPIFSEEYDFNNTTNSQTNEESRKSESYFEDLKDEFIKKIQEEYKLSKPRRIVIRARIIQK